MTPSENRHRLNRLRAEERSGRMPIVAMSGTRLPSHGRRRTAGGAVAALAQGVRIA